MASVDLRHAYYSVPIKAEYRKYLKFKWKKQLYQYTCFPDGLSNCPRYFTKLMKPVYATLRSQGYLSTSFIDDSYLQGNTLEECTENVAKTVELLDSLGFIIHKEKSVLKPCKELRYLGFVLNSEDMTVTLPEERKQKVLLACSELKRKHKITIRELAQVNGQLVATFPAVLWGPLFYRNLDRLKSTALKACSELKRKHKITIRELPQVIGQLVATFPAVLWEPLFHRNLDRLKSIALKASAGNFEALTNLTDNATEELNWWIKKLDQSSFPIERRNPEVEIKTMPQVQEVGELFAVPMKREDGSPKQKSVCTSMPWK